MIMLIIYLIISCNSTNYYNVDVSGVKLDAFGKRGNYIDSVDNRINDRIDYYMQKIQEEKIESGETLSVWEVGGKNIIKEEKTWKEEVKSMDSGIQEIVTALTSAIAGVYCLVKTIINIIKKIKK